MKLAIMAGYYYPASRAGGPPRSLRGRVRRSKLPEIVVFALNHDHLESRPFSAPFRNSTTVDGARVHYVPNASKGGLFALFRLRRDFTTADVVWLQSLYDPMFSLLPLFWLSALHRRVAVLISPRGGLATEQHAGGSRLKRVVDTLLRLSGTDRWVYWVASGEGERADISRLFPHARIFISPEITALAGEPFQPKSRSGPLRLLFLGRITRHKGLLEAIQILKHVNEPVSLTIAGPRQDEAYVRLVEDARLLLPPNVEVEWVGHVPGESVADLIRAHDALITPTAGENFGHSIAECLAVGRHVFLTDSTPWTFAAERGAATVISRTDPTAAALRIDAYSALGADDVLKAQQTSYEIGTAGLMSALSIDEIAWHVARPTPRKGSLATATFKRRRQT